MKSRIFTLLLSFVLSAPLFSANQEDWHVQFPAFKIAGNLYYVGTTDLAAYLIHTPDGNILINANYPQDLSSLRKSIEDLGFKYTDTKILLISHAHADHDGAVGIIQKQTGAKLMVMAGDVPEVESKASGRPGAKVDRVLRDTQTVELGGMKLVARLTPGHTRGCTTWTMQVEEGDKKLNVVIVGSPNVNPGYVLAGNRDYPQIADDYQKSFRVWSNLPIDIFLGAHGSYFDLKTKYPKLKDAKTNPFIDPEGYRAYLTEREKAFRKEWERQRKSPGSPAP
jgi:metallo-beta-lactamase class B